MKKNYKTSILGILSLVFLLFLGNSLTVNADANTWTGLGGSGTAAGSWESTNSPATNINNTYVVATIGKVDVSATSNAGPALFTDLTDSQTISWGAAITLSGVVGDGSTVASNGGIVEVTINGTTTSTTIAGGSGAFTIVFPKRSVPASGFPYTISYTYGGDGTVTTGSDASTTLTVDKKSLSVTAVTPDITYGDAEPTPTVTYSGFVNTDGAGDLDNVDFALGTDYSQFDAVGTYNTTIAIGDATDNNYDFTPLNTSTFEVGKLALAVTAVTPDITYGDAEPTPTVTYSGFVSTDGAGDLDNVDFALGTDYSQFDAVGTYNTTIAIGDATDNNYDFTPLNTSTFEVGKLALAVTAVTPDITYGDAEPTPTVTYSGFVSTDGAGDLDNVDFALGTDYSQFDAVGTYNTTIAIGDATDNNYDFTPLNTSTFEVGKLALAVTAVTPDITYGDAEPTPTVTYSGFVSTDGAGDLDNVDFALGTDYSQFDAVGTYNTTIAIGDATDNNYDFTPLNTSTFEVGKLALAVTAVTPDITYGDAEPTPTVTYSGFVSTDGAGDLDNVDFALGTDYSQFDAVGTYNTTIAIGDATDNNYDFTPLNTSTFEVGKLALAVTAVTPDITYGDAEPTPTVTYSGFVSTDGAGDLDNVDFALGTDYSQFDAVGTYNTTIAIGDATDNNYDFTPLNTSTFEVGKLALAVTAVTPDITYGDAEPTPTVTYSGFVSTDGAGDLDNVDFALGTDYSQFDAVGTYNTTIAIGDATDNNYDFTPLNTSTFEVGKLALAVTAVTPDITYGDAEPTPTVTYSGFVSTDGAGDLDNVDFALGTDYSQFDAVGTYNTTIAIGDATDNNYDFTPLNTSTFEVGKLALAVTAVTPDITYGDAEPTPTVTYSGFVSTDGAGDLDNVDFALGTDYSQFDAVGTYNTTIAIGDATDNNYDFTPLNTSTFEVDQKKIDVTANSFNKTYGVLYTFLGTEFTTDPLVNTDVKISATLSSDGAVAIADVLAGGYVINISDVLIEDGSDNDMTANYDINYVPGTLTVDPKEICASYSGNLFVTQPTDDPAVFIVSIDIRASDLVGSFNPADVDVTFSINPDVNSVDAISNGEVTMSGIQDGLYTFSQNWDVNLIGNDGSPLEISWIIGGNYTLGDNCEEVMAIGAVAKPTDNFVTGGGYYIPKTGDTGGSLGADGSSKINFGLSAKMSTKGKNQKVTGGVNIIWRTGGDKWQAKSSSGSAPFLIYEVTGEPGVYRAEVLYTNANVRQLETSNAGGAEGNGTIAITVVDWGEPGLEDEIGIVIKDSKGNLLVSYYTTPDGSNDLDLLEGGNIQIHAGRAKGNKRVVAELVEVPWNTPIESVKMEVEKMSLNWFDAKKLPMTLQSDSYDPLTPGIYELKADLVENEFFKLDEPVAIQVLVQDKPKALDIELSENIVAKNVADGTVIGTLSTLDPADDIHTYSMDVHPDLDIQGNKLIWKGTNVPAAQMELTVFSTDRAGQTISKEIKLSRELKPGEFFLYPNPAESEVTIGVELDQSATVGIRIYDAIGRLVYQEEGIQSGRPTYRININHLSAGLYMVQVKTGQIMMMKRLIKN